MRAAGLITGVCAGLAGRAVLPGQTLLRLTSMRLNSMRLTSMRLTSMTRRGDDAPLLRGLHHEKFIDYTTSILTD